MSKSGEYYGSMVSSKPACGGYAPLGNYNGSSTLVPSTPGTINGVQIVPDYGMPGYNTLVRGGGCGGYPDVMDAYGQTVGGCNTKYVQRMCGDLLGRPDEGFLCNDGTCQQVKKGTQRFLGEKLYPNMEACTAQCHSS